MMDFPLPPLPEVKRVGLLVIASGTEYASLVYDVRQLGPWAVPSESDIGGREKTIFYHHTASLPMVRGSVLAQLRHMRIVASNSEYGLPYNFVVIGRAPHRIYYLNDIDMAWPHTYGRNSATAIAAWGNYSVTEPAPGLVPAMWKLADALATMWGEWHPERQHRDIYATECPGTLLSSLLIR